MPEREKISAKREKREAWSTERDGEICKRGSRQAE
jgi:hypothetical protein